MSYKNNKEGGLTHIFFNNSSDKTMTAFITKKEMETSAILDPPF